MEQTDYRLAAILYTDIVGFSRMMSVNEAETLKMLHEHNTLIEKIVEKNQGTVIKTIGDAYMVSFRNTVNALQSAIEIQDTLYEYNCNHENLKVLLRIGIHLGDIYFYENDALGDGINIAARLQSFAKPGCICFSQDVFNQVLNKIDFHAEKLGKVSLKNITKEIHAFEIETKNIEFDYEKTSRNRKVLGEEKKEENTNNQTYSDNKNTNQNYQETNTQNQQTYNQNQYNTNNWNFETDGKRLGLELNRAVKGLFSIAENKLNTIIDSVECVNTPEKTCNNKNMSTEEKWQQWLSDKHGHSYENNQDNQSKYFFHDNFTKHYQDNDSEYNNQYSQKKWSFENIRLKAIEKWEKARKGLTGHLISFFSVNAFLWFINFRRGTPAFRGRLFRPPADLPPLRTFITDIFKNISDAKPEALNEFITSFNQIMQQSTGRHIFPWAAIVTCAWGIGLLSNIMQVSSLKRTKKELESIIDLPEEAWNVYKKMDDSRTSMKQHTTSTFSVSLLLIVINIITTPFIPWSFIPCLILIISWLFHFIGHKSTINGLKKRLCSIMGVEKWSDLFKRDTYTKTQENTQNNDSIFDKFDKNNPYYSLVKESEDLKDSIIIRLSKKEGQDILDKDTEEILSSYVGQIKLLATNIYELDGLIQSIPLASLKREKVELSVKMKNTENEQLKREYQKSISEIEKHEEACVKIEEQKETLDLRLKSSVQALKRIQLDVTRMSVGSNTMENNAIFNRIRQSSTELSQYIEDIHTGFQETDDFLALNNAAE